MNWFIIIIALVVSYLIYRATRREVAPGGDKDIVNVPGWAILLIVVIMVAAIGGAIATRGDASEYSVGTSSQTTYRRTTTTSVIRAVDQVHLVAGTLKVADTGVGDMELSGKVKNTGRYPLVFVKVRGYALDEDGKTINTDFSYIDSDILGPGGTATYTIYVSDPNEEGARGRVETDSARFDD